jgi:hypothetical protein
MRACLLWGLAFFIVAHFAILLATQRFWPHLRDPEFGYKLNLIRKLRKEEPDRPLLVLLGSSRTGQGLRPGVLKELRTPDGREPLVFNFSLVGSGPLAELVTLRRLLDAGVRPDWLAIEILPAVLGRTVDAFNGSNGGVSRLSWPDVRLLTQYVTEPEKLSHNWYLAQLLPWYANRFSVMNHYLSNWVPWRLRLDHWKQLDRWGWSDIGLDDQPLVTVPCALDVARRTYQDDLRDLHITPMQDRALRDLLALCRQEHIPTLLYMMPEGSIFRAWYTPPTWKCLETYLAGVSREYGVPVVNARTWMPDMYFGDCHHLYRLGATCFTQRFGKDALSYLIRDRQESIPSLLVPVTSVPLSVVTKAGR